MGLILVQIEEPGQGHQVISLAVAVDWPHVDTVSAPPRQRQDAEEGTFREAVALEGKANEVGLERGVVGEDDGVGLLVEELDQTGQPLGQGRHPGDDGVDESVRCLGLGVDVAARRGRLLDPGCAALRGGAAARDRG